MTSLSLPRSTNTRHSPIHVNHNRKSTQSRTTQQLIVNSRRRRRDTQNEQRNVKERMRIIIIDHMIHVVRPLCVDCRMQLTHLKSQLIYGPRWFDGFDHLQCAAIQVIQINGNVQFHRFITTTKILSTSTQLVSSFLLTVQVLSTHRVRFATEFRFFCFFKFKCFTVDVVGWYFCVLPRRCCDYDNSIVPHHDSPAHRRSKQESKSKKAKKEKKNENLFCEWKFNDVVRRV